MKAIEYLILGVIIAGGCYLWWWSFAKAMEQFSRIAVSGGW